MRQNLRKVICIVLCIAITIQPVTIISANTGEYYSTVSDELLFALGIDRKAFNSGQFDEVGIEYPCIIWVNDIDMEPAVIYGFDCAEKTRDHPRNSANYPYEVIYTTNTPSLTGEGRGGTASPVQFPGTGDIFSSIIVGRLQDGDTLQHATQTSMDTLRHWIDLNKDNEDKNRGIPVERHLGDL